jgi:hypothetical protein
VVVRNVRKSVDVSLAILVHAAFFGIGLMLMRWGKNA